MTLRARLVAGLFLLMSVGLAIFGVTMYELYSGSQYRQLSADLKNAVPLVTQELAQKAGVDLPKPRVWPEFQLRLELSRSARGGWVRPKQLRPGDDGLYRFRHCRSHPYRSRH